MQVVKPITVTDSVLIASSIPEDEYTQWSAGTSYVAGHRVIVIAVHKIYEAVAPSTGVSPINNDGSQWVEVAATNRWRAFDRRLGLSAGYPESITYVLSAPSMIDTIAFLGLEAGTLRVLVKDPSDVVVFDEITSLADTSDIADWQSFFFWEPNFAREYLSVSVAAYPGSTITLTIIATGGIARVGQVVPGRAVHLGTAMDGTTVGITDYSRKDRDDFGNVFVVKRAFADKISFQFAFPVEDAGRIKRVISGLRATPAVYAAGSADLGTTVYGFLAGDLEIPLVSAGYAFATLEIEGLV